jgi:exosome complex RNA-binding protein Rrp42 (RNase PH superfamily)
LQLLHITGSKKHQLILNIDVFLLTPPHLSQIELIITGIKSALEETKIPEIVVAYNQVTEEESVEMTTNFRKLHKNNWDEIMIVGMTQDMENTHFVIDMKRE